MGSNSHYPPELEAILDDFDRRWDEQTKAIRNSGGFMSEDNEMDAYLIERGVIIERYWEEQKEKGNANA